MKKITKIASLGLSLVCATMLVAGCGGGNSDKKDANKKEISVMVNKNSLTNKNKDIPWVQELEKWFKEETGYTIKWQEVTSDWGQKKQTMFASGSVPDLILADGGRPSELLQYKSLFEDLSDDLDKMPNVEKLFEQHPETKYFAENQDGSIYGLTGYSRFWPYTATRQYINKDWLAKLNLDMPTTWDELFEVLKAFKDQDPNGNGKNDEVPIDWSPVGTGGFGYFQPSMLVANTGLPLTEGGNQGYFSDKGTLNNFFTAPEYKEAVKFLNKCWEAGLVNKAAFTQDYSAYQSVGRGGADENTSLVGFSWGWVSLDRFGAKLADQYESMAPLKMSADGPESSWSYEVGLNYTTNSALVSAKSNHKEAIYKLIDKMYDKDYSLQQIFGSFDVVLEKESEDKYKVLSADDPSIEQSTWQLMNSWGSCVNIPDDIEVALGPDLVQSQTETEPVKPVLDKMKEENSILPINFLKYSAEDQTTLANNNTNLMNIAMTNFSKWVTEGGIDKEWDAYVKQMEAAGLKDNIKIMQKSLDEYNEFVK